MLRIVYCFVIQKFIKIHEDKADLAIGDFAFGLSRCTTGLCLENGYGPMNFFTKYPPKSPPMWNLINLFPPLIWGYTFLSIFFILLFFIISTKLYSKIGLRENIITEEILLVPFRIKIVSTEQSPKNVELGFSSSLALLLWSIWGGFILHMMLSNYLAVLMKPSYEKPIDTLQDFYGILRH